MDDLAKELGMSKKTIYQHFKDKKELVQAVFLFDIEMDKFECTKACNDSDNAIQQFINILLFVNSNLKDMNPTVIFDLKKYYPHCWKQFDSFTNDFIFNFVIENIKLGISQGLYRKNLDPQITGTIYISLVHSIIQSGINSNYKISLAKVHEHIMDYHFHAICTEQGLHYLEEHLNL